MTEKIKDELLDLADEISRLLWSKIKTLRKSET